MLPVAMEVEIIPSLFLYRLFQLFLKHTGHELSCLAEFTVLDLPVLS